MCEYIRRGQTSDFKLLSDAKCILGRRVRVKEVESLPTAIYFPCDQKDCALPKSKETVNEFQKSIYTRVQFSVQSLCVAFGGENCETLLILQGSYFIMFHKEGRTQFNRTKKAIPGEKY